MVVWALCVMVVGLVLKTFPGPGYRHPEVGVVCLLYLLYICIHIHIYIYIYIYIYIHHHKKWEISWKCKSCVFHWWNGEAIFVLAGTCIKHLTFKINFLNKNFSLSLLGITHFRENQEICWRYMYISLL